MSSLQVLEALENVNARLEQLTDAVKALAGTPVKERKTREPKAKAANDGEEGQSDNSGCMAIKKSGPNKGKQCGKKCRVGTKYCSDHPEGMTKADYEKSINGEKPKDDIKTNEYDDDEYKVITHPTSLKGVVLTNSQPYRAICKDDKGSLVQLTDAEKKLLSSYKITLYGDEASISELAESTGKTIKETKPARGKKIIEPSSSSESEEEIKPAKKAPDAKKVGRRFDDSDDESAKSKAKPSKKGSDSDTDEVKPKSKPADLSAEKNDADEVKPSKKPAEKNDADEVKPSKKPDDSDEEPVKVLKKTKNGRKVSPIVSDDSDSSDNEPKTKKSGKPENNSNPSKAEKNEKPTSRARGKRVEDSD